MKRMTIVALSLVFLASGISSCGKSTKRKLVNEWKVASSEEETRGKSVNGDEYFSIISIVESVFTERYQSQSSAGLDSGEYNGKVTINEFSIKKDGTWSSVRELVYQTNANSTTYRTELNGTWTFVKKTKGDDFEKNERVLFNVLTSDETTTDAFEQVVTSTYSTNRTYLTGERVMIYTVLSSKKDHLELEKELQTDYNYTPNSEGMNYSYQKMTLKGK